MWAYKYKNRRLGNFLAILLLAGAGAGCALLPTAAWAQTDCVTSTTQAGAATSTAQCQYVPSTNIVGVSTPVYPPSSIAPTPMCELVTNNCGFDVMVPFSSLDEWTSFISSSFYNPANQNCAFISNCGPVVATCGTAAGTPTGPTPPSTNLCATGTLALPPGVTSATNNDPWN